MASISLRQFIRWVPDEASEPTSTVVVTSPGHYFVDLRVNKPDNMSGSWPVQEEKITIDQMDWAIAGTSSSTEPEGTDYTLGKWSHWVSSRTKNTENVADEGRNYAQPDGTTLEKGTMENPATGKDTEYEELWTDIDPLPVGDATSARSVVLRLDDGKDKKGSIVLVGHYCQAFMRSGDALGGERWEWSLEEGGWKRTVLLGDERIPCQEVLEKAKFMSVGDVIEAGGDVWRAIEVAD